MAQAAHELGMLVLALLGLLESTTALGYWFSVRQLMSWNSSVDYRAPLPSVHWGHQVSPQHQKSKPKNPKATNHTHKNLERKNEIFQYSCFK